MGNLKRFSTQYKGADDRVLLTGEDKEGATVSLWLTQRLLLKTIPVLTNWLQKNNAADLKTGDNSEQAREMAQVFTRKPVQPRVPVSPTQSTNEPVTEFQEPHLVNNIDLNLKENLMRLRFRQGEQELGNVAMNSHQLRQWLAVLQVMWKKAGWPGHIWPPWLVDDAKLVSNQAQGAFH